MKINEVLDWIEKFNNVSEKIGYPDARDNFHPRKDLTFCINIIVELFDNFAIFKGYECALSIQIEKKGKKETIVVKDGKELGFHLNSYIEFIIKKANSSDILDKKTILLIRGIMKNILNDLKKSVPITFRNDLKLTSLEETKARHDINT